MIERKRGREGLKKIRMEESKEKKGKSVKTKKQKTKE